MNTRTSFGVGGRGMSWGRFLGGLGRGEPWAYFLLVWLVVLGSVALWAGSNTMKKDGRR